MWACDMVARVDKRIDVLVDGKPIVEGYVCTDCTIESGQYGITEKVTLTLERFAYYTDETSYKGMELDDDFECADEDTPQIDENMFV